MAMQVLTSSSEIEMWGDGKQTRSFTFIDDCVEGILRVTKSDVKEVGSPAPHAALNLLSLLAAYRQKAQAAATEEHTLTSVFCTPPRTRETLYPTAAALGALLHVLLGQELQMCACLSLTVHACAQPLNLGSSEMVSMNGMMEMAMGFEEKNLPIKHIPGPEVPTPTLHPCQRLSLVKCRLHHRDPTL